MIHRLSILLTIKPAFILGYFGYLHAWTPPWPPLGIPHSGWGFFLGWHDGTKTCPSCLWFQWFGTKKSEKRWTTMEKSWKIMKTMEKLWKHMETSWKCHILASFVNFSSFWPSYWNCKAPRAIFSAFELDDSMIMGVPLQKKNIDLSQLIISFYPNLDPQSNRLLLVCIQVYSSNHFRSNNPTDLSPTPAIPPATATCSTPWRAPRIAPGLMDRGKSKMRCYKHIFYIYIHNIYIYIYTVLYTR